MRKRGIGESKVRLTGCTITANGNNWQWGNYRWGCSRWQVQRIQHNHFINTNSSARQFGFGVADHNLFQFSRERD